MSGYKSLYICIYTKDQRHASYLAGAVIPESTIPRFHDKGQYGHYHDSKNTIHIWFGNPIR